MLGPKTFDDALDPLVDAVLTRYCQRRECELRPRYLGYELAERWLAWPRLGDLVFRRAGRSPYLQRAIAGILEERVDPRAVFSLGGLVRSWVD